MMWREITAVVGVFSKPLFMLRIAHAHCFVYFLLFIVLHSKPGVGNYFCLGATFRRLRLAKGRTFLWE